MVSAEHRIDHLVETVNRQAIMLDLQLTLLVAMLATLPQRQSIVEGAIMKAEQSADALLFESVPERVLELAHEIRAGLLGGLALMHVPQTQAARHRRATAAS